MTDTTRRRRARRRGQRAEGLAAWWLRLKGYRILARGFRSGGSEIDLIARRGRTLAVVEVKARSTAGEAMEAVSPRQRARIARVASAFVQRYPALGGLQLRFDVVLVSPARPPRHVRDAWREE